MAVTMKRLKTLGRNLDIVVLSAKKMNGRGGMYERMSQLEKKSGVDWTTLRGPVWVGDLLMMFMVRPRCDLGKCNAMKFPGECTN